MGTGRGQGAPAQATKEHQRHGEDLPPDHGGGIAGACPLRTVMFGNRRSHGERLKLATEAPADVSRHGCLSTGVDRRRRGAGIP